MYDNRLNNFYNQDICKSCAACCKWGYALIDSDDIKKISSYLKLDIKKFKSNYTIWIDKFKQLYLKSSPNNTGCLFLENNKCIIYPVRPKSCMSFPRDEQIDDDLLKICSIANMKNIISSLKKLYMQFDKVYLKLNYGECGKCSLCCTSKTKFKYPPVSCLECNLIKDYIEKNYIDILKNYIPNKNKELSCPYYNFKIGCIIYPVRPMYCRLFGLFQFEEDPELPKSCIYYGNSINVTLNNRYYLIKYLKKFESLSEQYNKLNLNEKNDAFLSILDTNLNFLNERSDRYVFGNLC